jgi:hypothetical protein
MPSEAEGGIHTKEPLIKVRASLNSLVLVFNGNFNIIFNIDIQVYRAATDGTIFNILLFF